MQKAENFSDLLKRKYENHMGECRTEREEFTNWKYHHDYETNKMREVCN